MGMGARQMKDTAGGVAATASDNSVEIISALVPESGAGMAPPREENMPIGTAHWLLRAEEARKLAKLCDDPVLRSLLDELARDYEDLAAIRHQESHPSVQGCRERQVGRV